MVAMAGSYMDCTTLALVGNVIPHLWRPARPAASMAVPAWCMRRPPSERPMRCNKANIVAVGEKRARCCVQWGGLDTLLRTATKCPASALAVLIMCCASWANGRFSVGRSSMRMSVNCRSEVSNSSWWGRLVGPNNNTMYKGPYVENGWNTAR